MKLVKIVSFVGGRAWFGCQNVIDVDVEGWEEDFDLVDEMIDQIGQLTEENNMLVGYVDEQDWIVWIGGDERNDEGRKFMVDVMSECYEVDDVARFEKMFDLVVNGKMGQRHVIKVE